MKQPLTEYRKSINPPYSLKDFPAVFLTLFILLSIPLTVIGIEQSRSLESQAKSGPVAFPTGPVALVPTGPYRISFPDGIQCYSEDNISDNTFQGDMAPGQV